MIWEQQWELFAPNFKNGRAHIDLTPYGCQAILRLYPGPGFGDLSHPTTRIVLRLMSSLIQNRVVIDIGCGSGILSLAAAAMGAAKVYGYDIDPEAVKHAKKNAALSFFKELLPVRDEILRRFEDARRLTAPFAPTEIVCLDPHQKGRTKDEQTVQKKIDFSIQPPAKISPESVLLMNMIHSEQMEAWSAIADRVPASAALIASGILEEDAQEYLSWRIQQGWQVQKKLTEEGWSGFILKNDF